MRVSHGEIRKGGPECSHGPRVRCWRRHTTSFSGPFRVWFFPPLHQTRKGPERMALPRVFNRFDTTERSKCSSSPDLKNSCKRWRTDNKTFQLKLEKKKSRRLLDAASGKRIGASGVEFGENYRSPTGPSLEQQYLLSRSGVSLCTFVDIRFSAAGSPRKLYLGSGSCTPVPSEDRQIWPAWERGKAVGGNFKMADTLKRTRTIKSRF